MTDSCCQITIDTASLQKHQRRVLVTVLLINITTFTMMALSSFLSGSSSLLSGALDNFGDAVTYAISFAVVGAAAVTKARVALLKGLLIFGAAIAVGIQIVWRLMNPDVPVFETMGLAAVLNLAANLVCLRLLTPFRHGDVNMASARECSRNDVTEGVAVILAAFAIWAFCSCCFCIQPRVYWQPRGGNGHDAILHGRYQPHEYTIAPPSRAVVIDPAKCNERPTPY